MQIKLLAKDGSVLGCNNSGGGRPKIFLDWCKHETVPLMVTHLKIRDCPNCRFECKGDRMFYVSTIDTLIGIFGDLWYFIANFVSLMNELVAVECSMVSCDYFAINVFQWHKCPSNIQRGVGYSLWQWIYLQNE